MKNRIVGTALLLALAAAPPAMAQSAQGNYDYSDLLRRATEGREPTQQAEQQAADEVQVEVPVREIKEPKASAVLDPEPVAVADRKWFLHEASEYADEPHRVRLVDRSRYDSAFVPATIPNTIGLAAGSILIDTKARQLFFGLPDGTVRRYGVAVGKAGAVWHGQATVGRTARWPNWYPTANIRRGNRRLKSVVRGGSSNPLGARAIYLYQGERDTLYRIHGTTVPSSIGKYASHGCIRMINEDVIELYSMVLKGATVTVR